MEQPGEQLLGRDAVQRALDIGREAAVEGLAGAAAFVKPAAVLEVRGLVVVGPLLNGRGAAPSLMPRMISDVLQGSK